MKKQLSKKRKQDITKLIESHLEIKEEYWNVELRGTIVQKTMVL